MSPLPWELWLGMKSKRRRPPLRAWKAPTRRCCSAALSTPRAAAGPVVTARTATPSDVARARRRAVFRLGAGAGGAVPAVWNLVAATSASSSSLPSSPRVLSRDSRSMPRPSSDSNLRYLLSKMRPSSRSMSLAIFSTPGSRGKTTFGFVRELGSSSAFCASYSSTCRSASRLLASTTCSEPESSLLATAIVPSSGGVFEHLLFL
mmetsp:Transcript_76719/g.215265  ORF Transcript_76719/g.215265 Transcript_76719/m.215265 type:complete len:205 (-) Transcript_76719:121-735(-)